MQRDLYNNLHVERSISPVAVGTTGTGKTGTIFDRQKYIGVMFAIEYGAITATNATFTVTMNEGSVTGTLTAVAAADLLGTLAGAGIGATGTRTSGVSKNVTKKVGYIGAKRYVQIAVKSTVTAGTPIAATAIGGVPLSAPAV